MSTDFRALCAEQPSDEDILELMPQQFRNDLATVSRLAANGAGPVMPRMFRATLNTGAIAFARAVLARWGRPAQPAPPAEGEIDQLVSQLRDYAQGEQENGWHDDAARFRAPVPVPVSDRPWERKGWCDDRGRCWFGREESDYWSANWTLGTPEEVEESCTYAPRTVCLPAHAIPLPAPQGGEVEP